MTRFISVLCVSVLLLFLVNPAVANTSTLAEQEKILQDITDSIAADPTLDKGRLDTYRRSLKDVRTVVSDISRAAEREKERLQVLLNTLGDAPGEGEEEDKNIAAKRQELRQAINAQDGRFKQASLLLTRTNATQDSVAEYEQARQRDRLFSRQAQWWQGAYMKEADKAKAF